MVKRVVGRDAKMVRRVGRIARIQNFISKHPKKERKNSVVNDMNQVGDVEINYEITDYEQKHAVLELWGGLQIEASFVEFEESEKRIALNCFEATRQVNHQSILAPIFLTYCAAKKRIFIFYERYDHLLDSWTRGKVTWWQQALCEQLQALKYLQDRGFIHTGLNNSRNFVIKNGKLKMLNITSTLQEYLNTHPGEDPQTVKRGNFRSLRDTMWPRYRQKKTHLTPDDEAFVNLFERNDIKFDSYVQKLITHPYAKNFRQCMSDFSDIHLLDQQKGLVVSLKKLTEAEIFDRYKGWKSKIRKSDVKKLKMSKGEGEGKKSKYKENCVDTLIRYLRNINDHRVPKNKDFTKEDVDKYFRKVYKEVKTLFPGLLSLVHQEIRTT